ncbi:MAG: hypothetical protein KKC75_05135 [Nanoarchaeota archaeon]|nr:hypothetical protein [Nanoarchaeota archaeon]MBU1004838.1 hypothetical protein [Nanoarchaeota archaeon]MBU1946776.1 hypothetical protein [Nanoarchaeota archaeon]
MLDSFGLEAILHRKRLFLIDTNVLFGSSSGDSRIEDDPLRLAASLAHDSWELERMQTVYDIIRQNPNVRLTREIYMEILSKLGAIRTHCHVRKKARPIGLMDSYFRNHERELVLGTDYWDQTKMRAPGYILQERFSMRHPNLKCLSKADISLLLKAVEVRLAGDPYMKLDIISADYGVKLGAELMFELFNRFPIGKAGQRRRLQQKRCMKVISRGYDEDYHDVFDSAAYYAGLVRQARH